MSDTTSGDPVHWSVQPDDGPIIDPDEDVEIIDDDENLRDAADDFEDELREGQNGADRAVE